jgi:GDP-L-fucose synthase
MNLADKIYIAGHKGLIGSAILRKLKAEQFSNIIIREHSELDLLNQEQVQQFFKKEKPDYVFFTAGKVGGVYANNTYRAEFIYENSMMQGNVIHQAYLNETKKLIFFSCSSVYPKMCPQPMKEDYLLTGSLEPTNEPFGIAKIAGMKMCESYNRQYGTDFISVIPTNVYGINQNYAPMNSQVVPAMIRKFHEAKVNNSPEVVIWGTGRPSRDFIFSDDLADATIFMVKNYTENEPLNIGTGKDYTIRELASTIQEVIEYKGKITYDTSQPEGVITKLQNISKLSELGWKYTMELRDGINLAYEDFLEKQSLV